MDYECQQCGSVARAHTVGGSPHGEYYIVEQVICEKCGYIISKDTADCELLLAACKKLVVFVDEMLPQAGKLCFDVGNLNDALCGARSAIAKTEQTVT